MKTAMFLTLCTITLLMLMNEEKPKIQKSSASPMLKIAGSPKQKVSRAETSDIKVAFAKQGIRISKVEAQKIQSSVNDALQEAQQHGIGNSKVDFISIEIAQKLDLDISPGSKTVNNVSSAIQYLLKYKAHKKKTESIAWNNYYAKTLSLNSDQKFLGLVRKEKFSPVKISWEDIGRHQGSVWGDRISDVGIWVRQNEADPQSASLALSVRRDQNYRDKVLVVPSEKIKVHRTQNGQTQELTLSQRLKEINLYSKKRDRNVIVSNQFAILPVPSHDMKGAWKDGVPPRAAFNFSIYPYGSTNYVITDVIEGSSEAVVGPGSHQYLYYNVNGKKAPFTASRAQDRPDLLELEARLKAQGMDVDVQRYYLIQIPLKKGKNIQLSNMGTPPMQRSYGGVTCMNCGQKSVLKKTQVGQVDLFVEHLSLGSTDAKIKSSKKKIRIKKMANKITIRERKLKNSFRKEIPSSSTNKSESILTPKDGAPSEDPNPKNNDPIEGLTKVAIGHGEAEGEYSGGKGFQGHRDDAPIRVTVVYFVTPVGEVNEKDMDTFTAAFKKWDTQAIWGGSFVTKESW